MGNLAVAYIEAGKLDLALPLFEETLKLQKAKLGPDHPDTLMSMSNLAVAYHRAGKLDLALPLVEETLEAPESQARSRTSRHAHQHEQPRRGLLVRAKQLDKSIPLFEETLEAREAKLGRDHPAHAWDRGEPGRELQGRGPAQGSDSAARRSLSGREEIPRRFAGSARRCSTPTRRRARTPRLANLLQEQLAEARKALPKDSPQLAGVLAQIGLGLLRSRRLGRGRAAAPRVPGHPREEGARRLEDVQHAVDARRGAAGPEEVRRRRAAAADRLRGDEAAGEDDPAAGRTLASPRPSTG